MYSVIDGTWLDKKVSVLPVSGKVVYKYMNKKGKKVHFYVFNILHSKRHCPFWDCTGDSLNTTYSMVHPIKFVLSLSLCLCLYAHIYMLSFLLIEGLIQNMWNFFHSFQRVLDPQINFLVLLWIRFYTTQTKETRHLFLSYFTFYIFSLIKTLASFFFLCFKTSEHAFGKC